MFENIRVFIGTEPKTEIARKVLQHSILRRTEDNVAFTPMIGSEWEYDRDGIQFGTGFSLRRWMIPAYCQWQGRAIYLDADQIVLSNISELWDRTKTPFKFPKGERAVRWSEGCSAWMTYQVDKFRSKPWPQTSVMVIDCAAAKSQWGWHLPEVIKHLRKHKSRDDYVKFMHATWMEPPPAQIESSWNRLMSYKHNDTKLLHFTSEPQQPWYMPSHELAWLWKKELISALAFRHVTEDELCQALDRWGIVEDVRKSNGLHPDYREFLHVSTAERERRRKRYITVKK